jgi:polyhydroxybutyrate depolymerase
VATDAASPPSTTAPTIGGTGTTAPDTTVPAAPAKATGAPKPSAGCGTSTVRALDAEKRTMDVGGTERFYLLTTPTAHDGTKPLPLVLDFHGLAEGAQVHTAMSDFGTLAKKEGFVVAFPNGTGQPVKWDANTKSNPNHDVEYVDQLLDQLGAQLCIDTSRVYATGLSYGAIMSSFLTCVRADRFAAVAPVAGLTMPADCTPSRPMPALTFHGTADPILKFNGGVDLGSIGGGSADAPTTTRPPADLNGPGYPAAVAAWAARNGCKPDATDTKVTENVIHRVYDCPASAPVEFYIVLGGGHAWPGSEFSKSIEKVVGPTTSDISATELAWKFFQRFQLP